MALLCFFRRIFNQNEKNCSLRLTAPVIFCEAGAGEFHVHQQIILIKPCLHHASLQKVTFCAGRRAEFINDFSEVLIGDHESNIMEHFRITKTVRVKSRQCKSFFLIMSFVSNNQKFMFMFKVITIFSKQRLDTRLKRPIRLSVGRSPSF